MAEPRIAVDAAVCANCDAVYIVLLLLVAVALVPVAVVVDISVEFEWCKDTSYPMDVKRVTVVAVAAEWSAKDIHNATCKGVVQMLVCVDGENDDDDDW
jgi:hypothetical protein